MQIVLTGCWNGYKPGKVFTAMPDGQANTLLRRNLAALVKAPAEGSVSPPLRTSQRFGFRSKYVAPTKPKTSKRRKRR